MLQELNEARRQFGPQLKGSVSLLEAEDPDTNRSEENTVQVISGASVLRLRLAGMQVSRAREIVRMIQNVDPESPVLVNGIPVPPEYRLTAGETIEFVHHAGEKG